MTMRNGSAPYAVPQSSSVPDGSRGRYSRKYVRVPADVMKHQIIPAASDAAAQQLVSEQLPKGSRRARYEHLLSQYIEQGIADYRAKNNKGRPVPQGILALPPGRAT